jgi:hypothetical protein
MYFVRFRLYDSLPSTKLQALKEEIAIWKRVHPEPLSWADADEYAKRFTRKIQRLARCKIRRWV